MITINQILQSFLRYTAHKYSGHGAIAGLIQKWMDFLCKSSHPSHDSCVEVSAIENFKLSFDPEKVLPSLLECFFLFHLAFARQTRQCSKKDEKWQRRQKF
mmetsp:Transcript_48071/g.124907  ORF Transcript_48071/g.124907 Transcript_48071/m.124907 type:complete len:101 (-) Transcript_48071:2306-2608(-)